MKVGVINTVLFMDQVGYVIQKFLKKKSKTFNNKNRKTSINQHNTSGPTKTYHIASFKTHFSLSHPVYFPHSLSLSFLRSLSLKPFFSLIPFFSQTLIAYQSSFLPSLIFLYSFSPFRQLQRYRVGKLFFPKNTIRHCRNDDCF